MRDLDDGPAFHIVGRLTAECRDCHKPMHFMAARQCSDCAAAEAALADLIPCGIRTWIQDLREELAEYAVEKLGRAV